MSPPPESQNQPNSQDFLPTDFLPTDFLPTELKLIPQEQQFKWLVEKYLHLSTELARCKSERTFSAQYAVEAEDRASQLLSERGILIRGLQHLYEHLMLMNGSGSKLSEFCDTIHPKLKEYVRESP